MGNSAYVGAHYMCQNNNKLSPRQHTGSSQETIPKCMNMMGPLWLGCGLVVSSKDTLN